VKVADQLTPRARGCILLVAGSRVALGRFGG
jgi:hypothetical protein